MSSKFIHSPPMKLLQWHHTIFHSFVFADYLFFFHASIAALFDHIPVIPPLVAELLSTRHHLSIRSPLLEVSENPREIFASGV
jgi:hypothetical protein